MPTESPTSTDPRFAWPRHGQLWTCIGPDLPQVDLAHDADHVLRVYRWAVRLAPEAGADPELTGAAALVHDLVNVPKDSPDRSKASAWSAAAAGTPLRQVGYSDAEIAVVAEAVRTCSWSQGLAPTNPEGRALQQADRLDAIGAVGIARNFACAQTMAHNGSAVRFYDPDDPLGQTGRPLDDVRNAADHYAIKLLRLAETMTLPSARAEAARRHAFLLAFLDQLGAETL